MTHLIKTLKRIHELGVNGSIKRLNNRVAKKIFAFKYKQKALRRKNDFHWADNVLLQKLKNNLDLRPLLEDPLFLMPSNEEINRCADNTTQNCFEILNEPFCFTNGINWHQDFKTKAINAEWRNSFYQKIKLQNPSAQGFDEYYPDAKIPWELSRVQNLLTLGLAYSIDHDQIYSKTFVAQVTEWMEQNPFLIGINWLCPMEVAIRSINLIWGFYFFKDEKSIPVKFWQKLVSSLHDHATYLESNWETSDKPNNHYIADLIGYFYLCHFFKPIPKFSKKLLKCSEWLLEQFDHQIQEDGTSYEGSTSYHKLVAEMFLHFKILSKINNISLPETFETKFEKMFTFLNRCSYSKNQIVRIGDDDSGKLVAGISTEPEEGNFSAHFQNFGLTIIKHNGWHITLRQPSFKPMQPTGHLHQDQRAITLCYAGEPVLIDAGSYLYTPNSLWRNKLRSATSHNTFYLKHESNLFAFGEEELFKDLFQLPKKENEYAKLGLIAKRELFFEKNQQRLKLTDWLEGQNNPQQNGLNVFWNFNIAPKIKVIEEQKNIWHLRLTNNNVLIFKSPTKFEQHDSFFAPHYGTKLTCTQLVASLPLSINTITSFEFSLL